MRHTETPRTLVIGLGNPGSQYECTYHNVGNLAVDYFESHRADLPLPSTRYSLLKSNVSMNESGAFVSSALRKHRVTPEHLVLVHDDSDIAFGKSKLSFGRGAAGHRGVEDVIRALGTADFWRLRIGIRKARGQGRSGTFVLRRIAPPDRALLDAAFSEAAGKLSQAVGSAEQRSG